MAGIVPPDVGRAPSISIINRLVARRVGVAEEFVKRGHIRENRTAQYQPCGFDHGDASLGHTRGLCSTEARGG
jgi:hypothetical protein